MFDTALFLIFPLILAFAAFYDLFSYTIPNWLSYVLVAGFVVAAPAFAIGWEAVGYHFLTSFAVLAVGFGLFAFGFAGGGDVKIASATALWLGPTQIMPYLVYAALFGGVLSLFIIILRTVPVPLAVNNIGWVSRLANPKNGVPYGIALSASAFCVYPATIWFQALA